MGIESMLELIAGSVLAASGPGGGTSNGLSAAAGSVLAPSGAMVTSVTNVSPNAPFRLVNAQLVNGTPTLMLEPTSHLPTTGTVAVVLEVWNLARPGGQQVFGFGRFVGEVTGAEGERTLTFNSATSLPAVDNRPPLTKEPGWPDNPLFGIDARLEVRGGEALTVVGPSTFCLPTLRFAEMAAVATNDQDDTESVLVQVGGTVGGAATICGRVELPACSLKDTVERIMAKRVAETPEAERGEVAALSFAAKPQWMTANRSDRATHRPSQHLETVVLHSMSAIKKVIGADKHATIHEMFDPQTCASVLTGAGAHYLIGRDGSVFELAHPRYRVAHAGGSAHEDFNRANTRSVGIELIGHSPEFIDSLVIGTYSERKTKESPTDDETKWVTAFEAFAKEQDPSITDYTNQGSVFYGYTKAQHVALGTLLEALSQCYGYIRVVTHGWYSSDKQDPGDKLDWAQITPHLPSGSMSVANSVYLVDGQAISSSRR